MSKPRTRIINFAILSIFLFLTLFIHFLHHDTGPLGSSSCPACHFQNSTLTTTQTNIFITPELILLDTLGLFSRQADHQVHGIRPASRSPPQA